MCHQSATAVALLILAACLSCDSGHSERTYSPERTNKSSSSEYGRPRAQYLIVDVFPPEWLEEGEAQDSRGQITRTIHRNPACKQARDYVDMMTKMGVDLNLFMDMVVGDQELQAFLRDFKRPAGRLKGEYTCKWCQRCFPVPGK